jgi:hypothetical protein
MEVFSNRFWTVALSIFALQNNDSAARSRDCEKSKIPLDRRRALPPEHASGGRAMSALPGGFNWSLQHRS